MGSRIGLGSGWLVGIRVGWSGGYSKVGIGLAGWVDKPSFISCTHVEIAMLGGKDLLKSIKSVCPVYFFELRMK